MKTKKFNTTAGRHNHEACATAFTEHAADPVAQQATAENMIMVAQRQTNGA